MNTCLCTFALCLALTAPAAPPRSPVAVEYTLRANPAVLSGVVVEMQIHDAPASFRVAMATHTEYDDRYWRFLSGIEGVSGQGMVRIVREDSSLWRVDAPAGEVTLRYRVTFPVSPPGQQASWMAHLTPDGGLLGGPHSFLYVVGAEQLPVRVTLAIPDQWRIVTGLDTTNTPRTFSAPDMTTLVDSPMLVGPVRSWRFDVDGVPHDVSWLGSPDGTAFDTTRFVADVEQLARTTVAMFGRMPYRRYEFLFEDGSYGGLEHTNSVSIGARSTTLARDPDALLSQLAHEFFHTWNEVHLRPASWVGVRHVAPAPTGELWWSEGVTLFYADLLLRRAGLHTADSTRVARLARLIGNYLANPSQALVSPEETSRAFNQPPGSTGDYTPSMFTQGEMLGTVLDLMIRDGSGGARSLDDAMRALTRRFSISRGFSGRDVEHAVADACACDATPFFDRYVRSAGALDFNRWLALIGLQMTVTRAPALAADGSPAPDLRFSAMAGDGDSTVRLNVWFPGAPLARAGFHTGDRLVSLNGAAIPDPAAARTVVSQLRIGDTLRVAARRGSMAVDRTVVITGYDRPTVTLAERADATALQRRLREQWMAGR